MTSLRTKLTSGQSCTGIFSKALDSAIVEAAGLAGLDFIILDTEHGPVSLEKLHDHVRAARLTPMASVIRVKGVDAHAIGSALDTGADGVQIPNVSTARQAEEAVQAARFHPFGRRGVCRFVRAASFGAQEKVSYFSDANEKVVILQVEGVEGVKNLPEILAVQGFDVLFIGPYDLSQSIGLPGEVDSPQVRALINEISSAAKAANKTLGIFCDTPDALRNYRRNEIPYIAYSVDMSIFRDAVSKLIASE